MSFVAFCTVFVTRRVEKLVTILGASNSNVFVRFGFGYKCVIFERVKTTAPYS